MVPAGFGREAATSVGRDPIPETRLRPHEPSVRVPPLPLCLPLTIYEHPRYLASLRSALSAFSRQRSASLLTALHFCDNRFYRMTLLREEGMSFSLARIFFGPWLTADS